MKKSSKTLKIVLVVLIVILLSIISFVGIYDKKGNNVLQGYTLGRNIEGSMVIKYVASSLNQEDDDEIVLENEEEREQSIEDSDEEITNENIDTDLTEENFLKSKKILQARLDDLGINDYEIRLDNESGDIYITLPDDSKKDSAMEVLGYAGSFEMKDAETDEVLLSNEDINSVKVGYGATSNTSNAASVYLTINFNKEGAKKLLDISNEYIQTTDEEGNTTEKNVSLTIEDDEIIKTYFSQPMTDGKIQLSIGSSTSDTSQLQEYLEQGSKVKVVLDNGKLPLSYTVDQEEYIKSDINQNEIMIAVYILIALVVADIVYIIIKYRKNGALSGVSYIASIAIFLLLIRYTNTILVLESIVAFLSLIILNHYLYTKTLSKIEKNTKSEDVKNTFKEVYKSCIDLLIVLLIISVVFVYTTLVSVNSIGMLLFWGIISIIISNFVFGRTLLVANTQK